MTELDSSRGRVGPQREVAAWFSLGVFFAPSKTN